MNRVSYRPSPAFLYALAVLLALTHALLALTAKREKSVTADEIAHLVAGYAYNTRGDFRLHPENGNLPQRWAALPLTWSRDMPASVNSDTWRRADVWRYGHALFYREGLSTDEMIFAGRAMITVFSAATALLVFAWSRALFGWTGAFLSLVLYAFCPAFLAHGALTTSDIVMTFFFLAAMGTWWRALESPHLGRTLLSAVVFGLACVAKFSAVLLLPMFVLSAVGWWLTHTAAERPSATIASARLLGLLTSHAFIAWLIIWSFYGFRFSAFSPDAGPGQFYRGDWTWILLGMDWARGWIEMLRDFRVLPEAFLYGFAFVLRFSQERAAFFAGDYSTTGWVLFFPFAFVVKSTLPFLVLLATTAAVGIARWHRTRTTCLASPAWRPLVPLVALFVVYWATSLTSHLNIGHRHILPTYPVLFIVVGAIGAWLDRRRPWIVAGLLGLVVWHAGESFRARPHYLAYFNAIVGGPQNGWRYLVDSSLDWGQDLPGLRRWLARNAPREPVFLSYFGTGDPAYEGIRATALPTLPDLQPRPWHALTPGVYAIGATMLQHVYSDIRGDWTLEREKEFQELRRAEPTLLAYQHDATQRAALHRDMPAESWKAAWTRYERLRFARLCHYLRRRQPDAVVGHSIFIFRLNADELHRAVGSSADAWRRLLEEASAER